MKTYSIAWASQVELGIKNLPATAGDIRDVGSIPELGRSPGRGHGSPLKTKHHFRTNLKFSVVEEELIKNTMQPKCPSTEE